MTRVTSRLDPDAFWPGGESRPVTLTSLGSAADPQHPLRGAKDGRAERRRTPKHSAMSGVVSNPVAQVCRVAAFEAPDELQFEVVGIPCLEQSAASA
jgi:hypothetical protein